VTPEPWHVAAFAIVFVTTASALLWRRDRRHRRDEDAQ
jgi:hypothetical protein